MLTREAARNLTSKVLALSAADQMQLTLTDDETTHLRFARNEPSTSGRYENPSLHIRSSFGTRSGSTSVNQFDEQSLAAAVTLSEKTARLAPEDPEFLPALGPQEFADVAHAYDLETAENGAGRMAAGVKRCIDDARANKLVAAGFTEIRASMSCIANSSGLFGYHRFTGAYAAETARTSDASGSGWAARSSTHIARVDYQQMATRASTKALQSSNPRPLAPGKYVAILEPPCVANLVGILMQSLSARSADEGRSYFSRAEGNRLGEKLFVDSVNISSDPRDPRVPALPWGDDGLPQVPRDWIKNGQLVNLQTDRFWANKTGRPPIPSPSNTVMAGSDQSIDDLIRTTERGVLVTSLWYIRSLDPRTLLHTGLTRDGVFWIEDGQVRHPVTNFRWNDSPVRVLGNIEAMSRAEPVPPRPSRSTDMLVPALKVRDFHFASVSDAV